MKIATGWLSGDGRGFDNQRPIELGTARCVGGGCAKSRQWTGGGQKACQNRPK